MIEQIGLPGNETISIPNATALAMIHAIQATGNPAPVVAEIGIGIGATTLAMAIMLDNRGQLHLYDFQSKVHEVVADLAILGFSNVSGFGNTDKYWDSYNWTLGRLVQAGRHYIYDYIYIDGAHTFSVDALAFILCDRLLKPGGYLEFDDYSWRFTDSRWMQDTRDQFMTEEQIRTPQIKMVVDIFLNGNVGYIPVQQNRLYRKVGTSQGSVLDGSLPCTVTASVEWRG